MTPLCFLLAFVFLSIRKFFFRNRLREIVPPLVATLWHSLNKFYESFLEVFWNEVLRVSKPVNKHAINIIRYYLKKMMSSAKAVSSDSGLIPSETVYEKRGLLWPIARKENLITVRLAAFFIIFVCNLVHPCKFHGNLKAV